MIISLNIYSKAIKIYIIWFQYDYNEYNDKIIKELIYLRANMYSVKPVRYEKEIEKIKGKL